MKHPDQLPTAERCPSPADAVTVSRPHWADWVIGAKRIPEDRPITDGSYLSPVRANVTAQVSSPSWRLVAPDVTRQNWITCLGSRSWSDGQADIGVQ